MSALDYITEKWHYYSDQYKVSIAFVEDLDKPIVHRGYLIGYERKLFSPCRFSFVMMVRNNGE